MTYSKGAKVMVALDAAEHAGTVQPGEFDSYTNGGRYAYVRVWSNAGGTRLRRVPVKNVNTAEKVKPLKRYESLFGKDD
jgi:hypothetical protein